METALLRCVFCMFMMVLTVHEASTTEAPAKARKCSGPPVVGHCRAAIPMWFFNQSSGECQSFLYGGCGGNANRHASEEECLTTCVRMRGSNNEKTRHMTAAAAGKRKAVIVGSNVTFVCRLNSTNAVSWFFYPWHSVEVVRVSTGRTVTENLASRITVAATDDVSRLTVSDVQLSDAGRYECLEQQTVNDGQLFHLGVYPVADSGACTGPPVTGMCRAWMPMWFYNSTSRECRRFVFGGCSDGSSNNRYDSRPLCESTCVGRPMEPEPSATKPSRNSGDVKHRGRVSSKTSTVTPIPPITTTKGRPKSATSYPRRPQCSGPGVTGNCRAAFKRWFFNETTMECQQFIYGGCNGSENRHDSRAECERKCLS